MKSIAKLTLALAPLLLSSTAAFADDPAWYTGKYYDPDNPASPTGFTTGYQLYRTIGCPGRSLLAPPCAVPPHPAPVAAAPAVPVVTVAKVESAPPPAAEAPMPAHVITREKPLVLKDVNFRFNHYDLMPAADPILDQAAADLKELHYPKVEIDGYTDIIGTFKYNLWLSDMRAKSVRNYLEKQGVPAASITIHGYGKTHFIATNKTREGRFENRRAEMHIEG